MDLPAGWRVCGNWPRILHRFMLQLRQNAHGLFGKRASGRHGTCFASAERKAILVHSEYTAARARALRTHGSRKSGGNVHLTTAMCAHHRSNKLVHISRCLRKGQAVRLVATSLIEAGVDIDFPVVWRAQSGLESIIQAAGRCNREGKRGKSDVFVFQPTDEEGRNAPRELEQFAAVARAVMRKHEDPASLQAIEDYFRETYWIAGGHA